MSARLGIAQASHKPIYTADEVEWMEKASCHGLPDHYFFPPEKARLQPEVRRICIDCEVRRDCLEFALGYGEWHGVWGGMTVNERRALARRRDKAAAS